VASRPSPLAIASNTPIVERSGLSRVFAQDDVIVEIAGQSITNIYDYTNALDLLTIGQPVKVICTGAGKRVETR
jgi:S1-C subfamily serine protease